jgi:hypothetical protein
MRERERERETVTAGAWLEHGGPKGERAE